jgi:NAD(P)-dependent dehydrogenase (short-subunit alcohol dehydrogenase family)
MSKNNIFDVAGKVAVVTGAAGQLGGEYVTMLLEKGARVAACDVWFDNPKSVLGKIQSDNLIKVKVDITRKESIVAALEEVLRAYKRVDNLINNAAIDAPPNADKTETGPFESYPEASWDKILDVNLKGMFLSCQIIGGHMAENGGGSIINISSIYGMVSPDQKIYRYKKEAFFKPVTYAVSKAGVLNLTRYLAVYWAEKNVRVNTLTLAGVFNNQDDNFLGNYTTKVPLGRMARQDEFNGAVIFLASHASSYVTGSNLIVDGGYTAL